MPAWLISMVLHMVLLLVLAFISISSGAAERILLTIRQGDDVRDKELFALTIDPPPLDDLPVAEDPLKEDRVVDVDVDFETFDIVSPVTLASVAPWFEPAQLGTEISSTEGAAKLKNMFAGRSGAMKQKLLQQAGGTKATEEAVELGLQWLRRNQLKDGSWSLRGPYDGGARAENKVSATAMAMLALMGAGSTHRGGPYQKELWRAARWLVKQQDRQGFMASQAMGHEQMYAQAQATIALCELYAMTGDSWIRPFAQRSCDFAVRAQSPQGGWRYQPRFDSDTSVTGWFVMGLKSGDAGGLEVDPYVFKRVDKYLDTVSTTGQDAYHSVGMAYRAGEAASPSMTAEGLLCRQYIGWDRNMPGMRAGLDVLVRNHPINDRERDVYYWYYATQSLHHYGGPMWTQWNDQLKVRLPASQQRQGRERGSWSPAGDTWGMHAGRLYTTCFSLYCLEVYYRHLPIYAPEQADDA